MDFSTRWCLLTAKQTCFVAGLAVAIIVFVTSSTRSVPVANTDAGHAPSSEKLSEPLPLAALGAAGAVDGETCVPICGRSPCAEPEINYNGISFCSYGRRQSQFLSEISGTDSAGGGGTSPRELSTHRLLSGAWLTLGPAVWAADSASQLLS